MALASTAHAIHERERTSDVLTAENVNVDFTSMFLSEPVTAGLQKVGFEKPSPIQLKAIPLGRCGLDLIVQAKSGTGKTCVFSVIALESLDLSNALTQVLVLAPTREIAVQIQDTIQAIGCEMEGLRCHVFIGGTLFGADRQKLKKCHVAVGTPGRIKQLIEYDVLKGGSIRLFVLDEADKLLDDSFQEQINWVYNHLPDNKQMLALSATYPESLAKHLTNYMRDPTFVRLNPRDLALRGIKQLFVELPGHSLPNKAFEIKVVKLLKILSQISFNQCLIFSNLQTRAQNLCDILCDRGWPSECISGSQEQSQRLHAMAKLKKFQCRILISTDLTARGIDAENVNLIINLDIPTDSKTYLHRIGRAGRFGTHGAAISLASQGREVDLLRNIQKQCHVHMTQLPDPAPSDLLKQSADPLQPSLLYDDTRSDHEELVPALNRDDHHGGGDACNGDDILRGDSELEIGLQITESATHKTPSPHDKRETKSLIRNNEGWSKESVKFQTAKEAVASRNSTDGVAHASSFSPQIAEIVNMNYDDLPKSKGDKVLQKVDIGVQVLLDSGSPPSSVTADPGPTGSCRQFGKPEDRRDLPIGFEDMPEVGLVHLPYRSVGKKNKQARKMLMWHEAKKSLEDFLTTRKNNTESGKPDATTSEQAAVSNTMQEGEGELLGASQNAVAEVSCHGIHSAAVGIKLDDIRGISKEQSLVTAAGEKHGKVYCYGSTPLQDIEHHRSILYERFMSARHNNATRTSTPEPQEMSGDIMNDGNEQIVHVIEAADKINPDSSPLHKEQKTQMSGESFSTLQTDAREGPGKFEIGKGAMKERMGSDASRSLVDGRKDQIGVGANVELPVAQQTDACLPKKAEGEAAGNGNKITNSNDSQMNSGTKKKGKVNVKQQRVKQHVFQMSTLGALMSHQDFNKAVLGSQRSSPKSGGSESSPRGEVDPDRSRQGVVLPSISIRDDKDDCTDFEIPFSQPGEQNQKEIDVVHAVIGSHAESTRNEEKAVEELCEAVAKSELGEQSVNGEDSLNRNEDGPPRSDEVWAIFKGFISESGQSKGDKPGHSLSEEGTSSDSVSNSSERDADDSASSEEEDDDGTSESDSSEETSEKDYKTSEKDEEEKGGEEGYHKNVPAKSKDSVRTQTRHRKEQAHTHEFNNRDSESWAYQNDTGWSNDQQQAGYGAPYYDAGTFYTGVPSWQEWYGQQQYHPSLFGHSGDAGSYWGQGASSRKHAGNGQEYTQSYTSSQGDTQTYTGSERYTPPYTGSQGYTSPYTGSQGYTQPYTGSQGHTPPYTGSQGYSPPYHGSQGYTHPYTNSQWYASPYAPYSYYH